MLRLRIDRQKLRRGIALESELRLPVVVQLVATGKAGPRPVAERVVPLQSVEPQQAVPSATVQSTDADTRPSSSVLSLQLNRLRKRRGVRPVRENRLLAELAAEHASKVCDTGRVAHELSPGSDPETRLAMAGVRARMVGETVARSVDAVSAFNAMKRSPSHLLTLLERRFTDAGVGVAANGSGQSCAVVLLAAWPRYVGR
jgi:uncharacterized protein YkwD